MSEGEAPGALSGLRVLDLTRVLAGPFCTMMLGDMGAEVLKVEAAKGDDTRAWGPPWAGTESAYYLGVNRNKRSTVMDPTLPEGREALAALIRGADVLVENFRTGTLARWGFDEPWFAEHAPRLVRCSVTGYGTTGPKATLPGYDFILQAESGLMSICGEPEGEPMKYGVAIVDLATGMFATIAILGALKARERTGQGQQVEASLFDSSLALLANVASNHLVSGQDARRFGNGHPNIVPYRTYPAADRSVAVAVGNDAQFVRFAALLGHPEWSADPRFLRNADRVGNRDAIDALVADAMAGRPADHWLSLLRESGIPCGGVNSVAQALADPQAEARDTVLEVAHPGVPEGSYRTLGFPFRMAGTPLAVRRPPPLLGEHTAGPGWEAADGRP